MSDVQTKELTSTQEYTLMKNLGGRKFVFAMVIVFVATLLMWFSKIQDGIYSVIIVTVIGAYLTSNVIQNLKTPSSSAD